MKKPNMPAISADVHAALCFALWHHQGGSSSIGQPIREMLGLGQHDHMTSDQYFDAKRVAEALAEQDHFAASGKMVAEPVKQEPVAWIFVFEDGECDPSITFDTQADGEKWLESDDCLWAGSIQPLYAAPVDAKAIRAEALEEAEERVTELYTDMELPFLPDITAAIRGLK